MKITTSQIREMRDQRVHDRKRLYCAPARVQQVNEEQIAILNELLEWREAVEAEQQLDKPAQIPLIGVVS